MQPDPLPPGISFDPPSADLFAADPIQRAATLADVATLIADCQKCKLCEGRTNTVPGEGSATARLVVIGEGPGRTEDETGRPFVGRAGELLTKILEAIQLPRDQVFICNIVKCRPPENRLPQYDEIAACLPFLYRQIELVKPKVILAMGGTAAQSLLNTKQSLGSLRKKRITCSLTIGCYGWLKQELGHVAEATVPVTSIIQNMVRSTLALSGPWSARSPSWMRKRSVWTAAAKAR